MGRRPRRQGALRSKPSRASRSPLSRCPIGTREDHTSAQPDCLAFTSVFDPARPARPVPGNPDAIFPQDRTRLVRLAVRDAPTLSMAGAAGKRRRELRGGRRWLGESLPGGRRW